MSENTHHGIPLFAFPTYDRLDRLVAQPADGVRWAHVVKELLGLPLEVAEDIVRDAGKTSQVMQARAQLMAQVSESEDVQHPVSGLYGWDIPG